MKALIQRTTNATLSVDGSAYSSVGVGLTVLVGIGNDDTTEDIEYLTKKIVNMRIFDDDNGVMNCSLLDIAGDILVVSQFTLMASTRKGNRPSYINAAPPDYSQPLYEAMINEFKRYDTINVATGVFGGDMMINLTNWGPVTIWLDSKNR